MGPDLLGDGSIPWRVEMAHTVEGARWIPNKCELADLKLGRRLNAIDE